MSSLPPRRIELNLFADPRERVTSIQENRLDAYLLHLPLCHGSARIECDGGVLFDGPVRPGLMRVLAPGERVTIIRRSAAEGAALTVPGPLFRRIADEHGFDRASSGLSLVDPVAEPDPRVERLGWLLGTGSETDPAHWSLFIEGVTLALLAIVLERRRTVKAGPGGGLTPVQLAACHEYADHRIGSRLDLAGWAGAVGMTPSQFTRRFRHTTRTSPYAWFLQRRIEAAKRLLARPDTSLATVALDVGFSSQSHFTDTFKRLAGMSPDRWRKQRLS